MIKVRNKVEKNLQDLKSKEFDWLQHYFGLKRKIPPKENKVLKEAEREVGGMIHKLKDDRTDIRLKVHKYKVLNGDINHGRFCYYVLRLITYNNIIPIIF
jgi:hypothetical protein